MLENDYVILCTSVLTLKMVLLKFDWFQRLLISILCLRIQILCQ